MVAFFCYKNKKKYGFGLDILLNTLINDNLLYHESTKGRCTAINVIINNCDSFIEDKFLVKAIEMSKKYKINFFLLFENLGNIERMLEPSSLSDVTSYFPYIIFRNKDKFAEYQSPIIAVIKRTARQGLMDKAEKANLEILYTDEETFIIEKYDTSKHPLYLLFYSNT